MNEVKKTLVVESTLKEYVSPEVKVILLHPEGVLCSSGMTEKFNEQDYSDGSFWN